MLCTMLFSNWKDHKMCLQVVMTVFILCPLLSTGVKISDEAHIDAHEINSGQRSSNSSVNLPLENQSTRKLHSEDISKNKTSSPANPKPVDTSVVRINEENKLNVTLGETQRGNIPDTVNFGAVLRGFYVFLGLSVIVIMYFTVRAIRLGRKETKVRKYGILANRGDLEMAPLGVEEEEDDITIYDRSSHSGH